MIIVNSYVCSPEGSLDGWMEGEPTELDSSRPWSTRLAALHSPHETPGHFAVKEIMGVPQQITNESQNGRYMWVP